RSHRQALGDDLSDLHLTAEAREDDLGSLLLCDAGGGEGDRGLSEHSGDENALSVEDSHGGPFFKGVDLSAPLPAASLVRSLRAKAARGRIRSGRGRSGPVKRARPKRSGTEIRSQ